MKGSPSANTLRYAVQDHTNYTRQELAALIFISTLAPIAMAKNGPYESALRAENRHTILLGCFSPRHFSGCNLHEFTMDLT